MYKLQAFLELRLWSYTVLPSCYYFGQSSCHRIIQMQEEGNRFPLRNGMAKSSAVELVYKDERSSYDLLCKQSTMHRYCVISRKTVEFFSGGFSFRKVFLHENYSMEDCLWLKWDRRSHMLIYSFKEPYIANDYEWRFQNHSAWA